MLSWQQILRLWMKFAHVHAMFPGSLLLGHASVRAWNEATPCKALIEMVLQTLLNNSLHTIWNDGLKIRLINHYWWHSRVWNPTFYYGYVFLFTSCILLQYLSATTVISSGCFPTVCSSCMFFCTPHPLIDWGLWMIQLPITTYTICMWHKHIFI